MSKSEREEQKEPQPDQTREPLLTPDHLTDADTEFKQNVLAEEAAHGLDQLEGPDIKAVMHREDDDDDAYVEREADGDDTREAGDEALDDLFDPPGYYDAGDGDPASASDEDVGVRDKEVSGPRRQVGEAAHNPPIGEAPKAGKKEEN